MLRWCFAALVAVAASAAEAPSLPINSGVADAAMSQDKAAMLALITGHKDVNAPQADGSTALLWAAHWNDLESAELLLKAGADSKAANRYGITPLSEACSNGNPAMVKRLLEAGADPGVKHGDGETALMTAARAGNPEVVNLLLAHGAEVNPKETWRGQTALMWAAAEGHREVVATLLEHGADVNAKSEVFDFTGLKPKAGSVPMNFPRGGFTALLFAARQGDLESARLLVEHGADVNLGDPDGTTPLIVAIINLHYDLAGFLLNHGADPNAADGKGRTPLYAAVDMHTMDITTRPTPKIPDKLDSAAVARLLLEKGANPNARLLKFIPPRGVLDGPDMTMGEGATPFIRAAHSGDVALMRLLMEHGADPKITTKAGTTALAAAAGVGWRDGKTRGSEAEVIEALKICLDQGIDINAADDKGETAMHGAASRGGDAIIQFLADHGAKTDLKDSKGRTPLDVAMGVGAEVGGVRAPHDSTIGLLKNLMAKN
ncbi:MAG: ankyrin repeat domain-containing protein [Acidobacteriia bacterium]|nr:ankyrin repeat domain-containing protein [Terriglobia bacterium]